MSAPRPSRRIGWTRKSEKGETHSSYNDFFEVFDVPRLSAARYEEHVAKLDNRPGFIDVFRPGVISSRRADRALSISMRSSSADARAASS